ncbi:polysaccharide biosynthesis tyrosine autokinase [uncultured Azonexus sp.]|uniref:GumC family protein n=1 Tax=uncultured Azonexus sp. TaxID=520307 RepID=UPI00263227E0|nr:polysaccharide biosynthesis tyrosine autokinase [uncultured Azonexus sp.]
MPQSPAADSENHKPLFLHDPEDREEKLELLEYWRSILKRKKEIIGFGLVVALVAVVIVLVMTPVYRSTATVLIEANKSKLLSIEDVYSGISQNREHFQTQVEIIKSREVAIRTIEKLKLWEHEEFDPRPKEGTLRAAIGFSAEPKEWTDKLLAEAVYENFSRKLIVEPIRLSQLAKVSFESSDAALASQVANTAAEVYIQTDLEARFKLTRQASGWLQDQLSDLRMKLNESEKALQEFREREGIVDLKSVTQSGAGRQIEEVMGRLVEARMKRAEAEGAYQQIRSAPKGSDLSTLPAVLRNPIVADAKRAEGIAERQLSEVSQRYGKEHPRYVQAESELASARDNLRRQVESIVASVIREYEVARGTESTLEGVLSSAKGSVQVLNRKEGELSIYEREVEANRQMYDMFIKRTKETNVAGDLQTPIARVVDPAVIADKPIKPKKAQIVVIAFALGIFLGVLAALLRDRLDNTLKTTEDVEVRLKQPILTTLPLLSKEEVVRTKTARIFLDQPQSIYAEAIRTARTGVLLSGIDLPRRTLLVTSSLQGEGKTTFSINLAMAHAHTKKTLLIDADMRRPAVSKGLEIPVGAKGLSNFVAGSATLQECLLPVEGSSLMLMPSGSIPPNPLELLLSQRFKETLEHLGKHFEVIIIDSPPVELVSDALVIAALTNGTIYVSKAESTPYQVARKGIQRIRRADGQILGVVLNQFDMAKAGKYYGDYSGYGYQGYQGGYGVTYGEESGKA